MLYVPNKFLFIHIPRTAGNTITRMLCRELIEQENVVCWSDPTPNIFHRHSRAVELCPLIPDFDTITKFAVERPYSDIVQSYYRLLSDTGYLIDNESIEEFERRKFVPWLVGRTPWEHWCCDENGGELGVHKLHFADIDWGWICRATGVRNDVSAERKDWQTMYLKGEL